MFIKEFTDEQYLEIRLILEPIQNSLWFSLPPDERIIGWVSVEKNDNIYPGIMMDGECFYQITAYGTLNDDEKYALVSEKAQFELTENHIQKIINGHTVVINSIVTLNPENKNVH